MFRHSLFRHKCLAVALTLSLLAPLLVACGSPTPAAPATLTPGPAAAAAKPAAPITTPVPRPEGVLRVGLSTLSREVLDPYEDAGTGNMVISLIYDSLVGTNADGSDLGTIGGLANKWEQKADFSGWTFYLRKGMQWDKGFGEVTAEDVKFSLDRLIFRDGGQVTTRPQFRAGIKEIAVVDPYTLRIDTNTPFLELPEMLSLRFGASGAVVPKKTIEQMGEQAFQRNPVTSGPYRMVEHQAGSQFKFEARSDYWGGVPRYKEIYTYNVPEDATRAAMLKRGELDIAEVTIAQLKDLETAGFQLIEKKDSVEFVGYMHNQWEAALAKKEVRQALNLAVNRQELAAKLFEGRARPNSGDTPSFMLGSKEQTAVPYDPQDAKRLLAQAGYPNGFDLSIVARPQTPLPLLAEALAGYYRAVGISATVRNLDGATATNLWREGKLPNSISPFNNPNYRFFTSGYRTSFTAKGPVTLVRDTVPQLEGMIDAAGQAKTLEQLAEHQGKIQKYVRDDFRYLYLLHAGGWFAAGPKLNIKGWNGGGQQNFGLGWWQLIAQ